MPSYRISNIITKNEKYIINVKKIKKNLDENYNYFILNIIIYLI